jgi:hypothetical protein
MAKKTLEELFPTLYNEELMNDSLQFSCFDMWNFAYDFHTQFEGEVIKAKALRKKGTKRWYCRS